MQIGRKGKLMATHLKLSHTFRSTKLHPNPNPNPRSQLAKIPEPEPESSPPNHNRSWCVYLIASTNPPLKTYIGSTNDFCRRLQQHNGELKGGAKSSRAGRPWVCACIVHGFANQSEACKFESKWKILSRKLPRRPKIEFENVEDQEEKGIQCLLRHRYRAIEKLKHSIDNYQHLEIDWKISP
uniref:GIY-YIG domain-containing protein n=1 Tax=Opuntia streptacantha TaxID=393608 RepID=A0A7C8YS97_OPUST